MKRFSLECGYCGHKWEEQNLYASNPPTCLRCKDTNIRIKETLKEKVDYYEGAPPFEDKVSSKDSKDLKADSDLNSFSYSGDPYDYSWGGGD